MTGSGGLWFLPSHQMLNDSREIDALFLPVVEPNWEEGKEGREGEREGGRREGEREEGRGEGGRGEGGRGGRREREEREREGGGRETEQKI